MDKRRRIASFWVPLLFGIMALTNVVTRPSFQRVRAVDADRPPSVLKTPRPPPQASPQARQPEASLGRRPLPKQRRHVQRLIGRHCCNRFLW